ncbi:hypothetical protein B0H16DRAFT_1787671 [Mycena metata]|uniref:Uncharacterized protein n=1 Tax=Mycena metata TaxID=1033252 RepID=A0AAD7HM32_9AGAR|nr:hypothetical protein B0H16DRAFT_1787671 [Mycena metata]
MSSPTIMSTAAHHDPLPTDEEELCMLDLEDADSLLEHIQDLVALKFDDFPDDQVDNEAARYAARMTKASITDGLEQGIYVAEGFEGRKYSTAVSTRAALTMWYRNLRPNESLTEWRVDSATNTWRGLPTRSQHVSQFMVGLEKTKAKSGEVSSSVRALALEDIHRLYDHCINLNLSLGERRAGTVRFIAYLLGWLMLLRIDEVIKLKFENIDKIPGERKFINITLTTRKQNQTGVLHAWKLHANDDDPKICPVCAFILLASLYGRCGSAIWLPHRHIPFRIFRGSANHNHMTASSFIPRATSFSSIKLRRATHIPISDILDFPECCSSLSILVPILQHRVSNDGKKYQFPIDMFLISYLLLYPHFFTHISSRHRHFLFTYVRQRDERISKSSAISDYAGD